MTRTRSTVGPWGRPAPANAVVVRSYSMLTEVNGSPGDGIWLTAHALTQQAML